MLFRSLPGSFNDLKNGGATRNGHLLPSSSWPSDHLAVGAELSISIPTEAEIPVAAADVDHLASEIVLDSTFFASLGCGVLDSGSQSNFIPPMVQMIPVAHPSRCGCGCVPNILSLFEMAELRKQARLRAKEEKEGKV